MKLLSVENVSFSYNKKDLVLDNLSFILSKGDFLTIAGPNGSGKTTLIKLIVDLLKLQKGNILIEGTKNNQKISKKKMVYLSSEDIIPEFLTGREFIEFFCKMYEAEIDPLAISLLAKFYSMENKLEGLIEGYSHGMKKKVQLIAAFLVNAQILIIDETLNGIDVEAKEATKLLMDKYLDNEKAIIFCTHDLELVEEIGDKVLLINKGHVHAYDSLSQLTNEGNRLVDIFKGLIEYEDMKYEISKHF